MIISYNEKELELLARIMRAEALAEGDLGMLMVGNVVTNRVIANCLTFKKVNSLTDVIYQKNQFVGTTSSLFQARPTTKEKDLAKRILKGEYYYPATHALWFYAPGKKACKDKWYDENLAGKYQNHCFYRPEQGECPQIF
jgi:N-acetylmuramoyl-L-alanine amidase